MRPCFLVRLTAGFLAVAGVGLALAQAPPESAPFEYYTHRCHPHHNQGKFCVPEETAKKKNIIVYSFKETDYCYPRLRCFLSHAFPCLFPEEEFGCPCQGCRKCCFCVRTKRVLLKKSVPCEEAQLKCRVEYQPCACPPYDPTRKPQESSKGQEKTGGQQSGGSQDKEGTRPKAGEGKQTDGKGSSQGAELPPPPRKWSRRIED